MEALLLSLQEPGAMNSSQWLLVAIIVFVLIGSAYFVYRLYKIIVTANKKTYVPNIGRNRLKQPGGNTPENGNNN